MTQADKANEGREEKQPWTYDVDVHGTAFCFYKHNDFKFKANEPDLCKVLNEYESLRDQLSKEREKLEQAKCDNENAWKGVKQVCAEKYELELKLEKERKMRKELLTKIKKICRGYVHYQDWTKFSYEFDIGIEKAASELDKK